VGGQPQRHALGQRDVALLAAPRRGERHPGADDPDVHHAVQEVDVVHGEAERLALPAGPRDQPGAGRRV